MSYIPAKLKCPISDKISKCIIPGYLCVLIKKREGPLGGAATFLVNFLFYFHG